MSCVLLATCARLPNGDEDGAALVAALASCGVQARWAVWDDPSVDWSRDLTVLRSTWDYTVRRTEFLQWTAAVPRLLNPAELVVWSSDKRYLADLEAAGLPVVATRFAAPGEPVQLPVAGTSEFVVKPSVGAGSRGAGRFTADAREAALAHAGTLHADGRTVLVQPYLAAVDTAGETALVYVDGVFSHAIRKGPMLPAGTAHGLTGTDLFVPEAIQARDPDPAELAVGGRVLEFVTERSGAAPLYARVDLLPAPGGPVVVELELVEPSLFLGFADTAAKTFAAAVAART